MLASDGLPRFVWTDERPDPASYVQTILASIGERQRWRAQYQAAVDNVSATGGLSPPVSPTTIPWGSRSSHPSETSASTRIHRTHVRRTGPIRPRRASG